MGALGQAERPSRMTSTQEVEPFSAALAALQRLLARFGDQGMIIGGVAASLLGSPRLTADVDAVILVSVQDLPQLIAAAEQEGLTPRLDNAEGFARRHRVLLLHHPGSGINVDISLGMLPFEVEAVERSTGIRSVTCASACRRPRTSLFSRR